MWKQQKSQSVKNNSSSFLPRYEVRWIRPWLFKYSSFYFVMVFGSHLKQIYVSRLTKMENIVPINLFFAHKIIISTEDKLNKYCEGSVTINSKRKNWFTEFVVAQARVKPKVLTPNWNLCIKNNFEIVDAIGVSYSSVVSILNDYLGTRKLTGRWVPCLLTLKQPCDNFEEVFENFQLQSGKDFSPFLNRGLHLDTPWYTGDRAAVERVSFSGRMGIEKSKDWSVSQQGHVDSLLACSRYSRHRLFSKGKNNQL